jgi:hypothetical protein
MDKYVGLNLKNKERKDKAMASKTMQTRCRRNLRKKNTGRKRKNKIAIVGSTPKFAIHKEEK